MSPLFLFTVLSSLITGIGAWIVDEGIWTGANWDYDDSTGRNLDFFILDGIAVFNDDQWVYPAEFTNAANIDDIYEEESVIRVLNVLSQEDWDTLFPNSLAGATFELFLEAIARYPYFCTDTNIGAAENLDSLESGCKRELAALLAHMVHETTDRSLTDADERMASAFSFLND